VVCGRHFAERGVAHPVWNFLPSEQSDSICLRSSTPVGRLELQVAALAPRRAGPFLRVGRADGRRANKF